MSNNVGSGSASNNSQWGGTSTIGTADQKSFSDYSPMKKSDPNVPYA
jgi:hypothetical protein